MDTNGHLLMCSVYYNGASVTPPVKTWTTYSKPGYTSTASGIQFGVH